MKNDSINIRLLENDDAYKLAEFFSGLTEKDKYFFYPHELDLNNAKELCNSIKKGDSIRFVALHKTHNRIVGYAYVRQMAKSIWSFGIAVLAGYRSHGIGKLMVAELLKMAKENHDILMIELNVHKENEAAIKLYKRMGFVATQIFYNPKINTEQYKMNLNMKNIMNRKKPLLGLCPIGKFVFSNDKAVEHKQSIQSKLSNLDVNYVDIDNILADGLVKDQSHVDKVVDFFKSKEIDCLFIPHCNFGTEGAAGMIAKKLNVPVLLWGPSDGVVNKDGTRDCDTLCGLFATSKVLHKLKVKFTYIDNCPIDDPKFAAGVDSFIRAGNVVSLFRKGCRIGHIGQRIDFFWTTIINESELLEKFNIEIQPIDMVEFIDSIEFRAEHNTELYQQKISELRKSSIVDDVSDKSLAFILAMADHMLELASVHGLDGFAVQDFMSLVNKAGAYCFLANSLVSEHYPVGCESDIHGVISNLLLSRVVYDAQPTFLADVTILHPEKDDTILMWHAGAPLSMMDSKDTLRLGTHWILSSPLSGMTHFKLKDEPITVARFDGDHGRYKLAIGQGEPGEGPYTQNNYQWVKVKNAVCWQRNLIYGPFIHHMGMIHGRYERALLEAGKFTLEIEVVKMDKDYQWNQE